jgi:putative heme-binding domain-containing protein
MTVGWPLPFLLLACVPVQGQTQPDRPANDDLVQGQRLFEGQCARCHGLKGAGGIGPSLTRARLRHAPSEKALLALIREGIPGTEMPWTWQMDDHELRQVAAYVRSLGRAESAPLPGDPARGRGLFEKGECAKCHTVRGQGGTAGPDLTEVGARRAPAYIRQALYDPGTNQPLDPEGFRTFLVVQAATHAGRLVRGVRVNEDTFTIQIRDSENRIHSFPKRDLVEVKREHGSSLMPSFGATIAPAELDDLVAYLASLRGEP